LKMETKSRSFRPVAFFAVALSTVAVLISVVTIPMVFLLHSKGPIDDAR